jgi:hypothetical protein
MVMYGLVCICLIVKQLDTSIGWTFDLGLTFYFVNKMKTKASGLIMAGNASRQFMFVSDTWMAYEIHR